MNLRQLINIIDEADKTSYEAWDHSYPAEYSKHLEKTFGAPDEATDEQVVWHNKDGFKRIVSRDEYILHGSPAPHYDFIYCYIDLEVPEDMSDELAKCSGSILIDHLKNEVGARCGSLTANAVTLNFVLDAVAGRVEPIKEEYEKRILDMRAMFEKGERYENDWWEDQSSDADPENPFYKEHQDEIDEGTRCWKGYERKGMKTMFGKRVPNCVKREDQELSELDTLASNIAFVKMPTGKYVKATFKRSGSMTGRAYDDAANFIKVVPATDNEVKNLGLDTLIQKGQTSISHPQQPMGGLPGQKPNVWVYKYKDEKYEEELPQKVKSEIVKSAMTEGIDYCVNCGEILFAEGLDENLKKWFKDKWVRFGPDGKIRGDCARGSSKEGKPKCLPRSKAHALGKKGRKKAASRKRRKDPSKNRKGKAINVRTK